MKLETDKQNSLQGANICKWTSNAAKIADPREQYGREMSKQAIRKKEEEG